MSHIRRVPLEHLYNCRDLGGYACEGGSIAWNRLYRCDGPNNLTTEEWQTLYDCGVRTVIDLRSSMEAGQMGYEPACGIERIFCPMQKEEAVPEESGSEGQIKSLEDILKENQGKEALGGFEKSLLDGYIKMVEEDPDAVARVLNLIGEHLKEGAVLFHCTAGKDRTGVTAALVYLICGVDPLDIIADYQITATYQDKNPMMGYIPKAMLPLMNSNPDNMKTFLQAAQEKDYLGLLRENGLKEETVETIQKIMIEQ